MYEFVVKIILFGSIFGIWFIIIRKIPVLINLPEVETKKLQKGRSLLSTIKSLESFLRKNFKEKIISGFKFPRKRNKKKFEEKEEVNFSEDYWEKIRKE
jgi:hypothetical protein